MMLPRLIAFLCLTALAFAASARTIAWPAPRPPLMFAQGADKPIRLQSLHAVSEISGGMAETTVTMVFFNPNSRPLEGDLQFPLLEGQQIVSFALDIEGKLRPAVPVEKSKGREIFEAIERRGVDPGLLEVTQGNNFKLRVYPIFAHGTRTVEIKYAEALTRDGTRWSYKLPLSYGDNIENFDLKLKVNGGAGIPIAKGSLETIDFHRQGNAFYAHLSKKPALTNGTLNILVPTHRGPAVYVQQHQGQRYFVAEIPIVERRIARNLPKVVGLLWDSSGSAASRDHQSELAVLDLYFRALGNAEVRLTRMRDRAEAQGSYRIENGNWDALREALEKTVYDGASALADWQPQAEVQEYLMMSDGLINYGPDRFPALKADQRLYALSSSLSADFARLSALAEARGGRAIQIHANRARVAAETLLTDGAVVRDIRSVGASEIFVDSSATHQGMLRVAGKLATHNAEITLNTVQGGRKKAIALTVSAAAPEHAFAARLWARYKLQRLEADYEVNRAAIRRLGTEFGLPTRETSLIVLERLDDYVRYNVVPPAEYLAAFEEAKNRQWQQAALKREKHIDEVVRQFEQKVVWWEKEYPKGKRPGPTKGWRKDEFESRASRFRSADNVAGAAIPQSAPSSAFEALHAERIDRRSAIAQNNAPEIGISLKKWTSDAPYIARMKAASAEALYAIYLDEKPSYANSSAFYLDAADMLFEKGQRELALRVLSNLAEMDLENRHVLRILGYRLLQAGAPKLAIPIFGKVKHLAEEEPQSFRDLGLAHAAANHYQLAIDHLNEVIERPWDGRFAEVELIALAELNAIVAEAAAKGERLDVDRIDPRLRKNLPLDLRVVLTWDADNSDMDLWMTDPNGEPCYYGNRLTYQGGRMSRDFTGGYGPEEFSLRKAMPGKYKIEANFYGHRQQIVAGATTLQVKLTTGFGTKYAKEQMITLRLKDQGSKVYVGEFDVAAN